MGMGFAVCQIWVQQEPFSRVRHYRVSNRVPESPLSQRIHVCLAYV